MAEHPTTRIIESLNFVTLFNLGFTKRETRKYFCEPI